MWTKMYFAGICAHYIELASFKSVLLCQVALRVQQLSL